MKRILKIAIPILILALFFAGIIIFKKVEEKLAEIPLNDPYEKGNIAGNLYNHGYFAEKNGKVYFANSYDNGRLYSMNPDQTDIQLMANGNVSFINVLGDYVYYYSSTTGDQAGLGYVRGGRGFYRTNTKDNDTFSMAKTSSDSMIGIGNHLYFSSFNDTDSNGNATITMESITTSNEEQTVLANEHLKFGESKNGNIYYAGMTNDHHLYSLDPNTGVSSLVSNESMYLPIIYADEIYFLDLEDDYHLKALSLSDDNIRTVINERIDTYNMYNGIIYYQNCDPDGYALKRIYVDGTGAETVATGVYKDINITGTYVYFTEFNTDIPVYQQSTTGPVNVTTFDRAFNSAVENIK